MDNQNAGSQVEALSILQDGKVGLGGATAPGGALEILGTGYDTTLRIASNDSNGRGIRFQNSSATAMGFVGLPNNDDMHIWSIGGTSYLYFYVSTAYRFYASGNDWLPYVDNVGDLGNASKRWDNIYATNDTIIISDISQKSDVIDTPLGLDFVKALRPIQYRWNEGTRNHQGFIAQDVEQVLNDSDSVTAAGTAMWMHAPHNNATEMVPIEDEDGIPQKVEQPVPDLQMLRYAEFIAPLVKAVQELAARVEALEDA